MQTITERTEEIARELALRTRVALAHLRHVAGERTRDERGQISAEFMGLLFIAALVIGAIVAMDIHETIADAADEFVKDLKSGDKPEGSPGG